jgi:hypothetical protein
MYQLLNTVRAPRQEPEFQIIGNRYDWSGDPALTSEGFIGTFPGQLIDQGYSQIWTDNTPNPKRSWKNCHSYKREVIPSGSEYGAWMTKLSTGPGAPNAYYACKGPHSVYFAFKNRTQSNNWGTTENLINGLPSLLDPQADGSFVPLPPNIDNLIHGSIVAMMPTIKADVSLVNFIIELKDLTSIPKTIANVNRLGTIIFDRLAVATSPKTTGLYNRIRTTFNKSYGPTMREVFHGSADANLQLQFGILPFLSDLTGIQKAMSGTLKRVNSLLGSQHRKNVRHFTLRIPLSIAGYPTGPLPISSNTLDFLGSFPTGAGTFNVEKKFYNGSALTRNYPQYDGVFHAQIEYTYRFTQFQVEYARILGILDSLGVNLNPAIIWNALPWSFVVDWVANVSRWLDSRKQLNMQPTVDITRYLYSWKVTRSMETLLHQWGDSGGAPYPATQLRMAHVVETAYRRTVGIPSTNTFITSGLNSRELSLGASLIIAKKFRPARASLARK